MKMARIAALAGLVIAVVVVAQAQILATKDGLRLSFDSNGSLREIQLPHKRFSGAGGFSVAEPKDTPENLNWIPLRGRVEREGNTVIVRAVGLGLELAANFTEQPDAIFCAGILRDTTNTDRAVVLSFALPIDAANWQWWDNLRSSRLIDVRTQTRYTATIRYGERGEHSLYPFCALNTDDVGIALGIPLDLPVVHRFVYDAAQKQLRLEWDFGLSPDGGTKDPGRGMRRPNTAIFRFAIYTLDEPRWGMRAAADKFYRLFPESFRVRVKRFGIWMPFTDIAKITAFEDFGFAYHEGAGNPSFNRQHDIYNFRYEEPWSAWFFLPPDASTDLTLEQLFAFPNKKEQHPHLAEIVKVCGVQDERGHFSMRAYKTDPVHWAGGQTLYNFLVNADPDIERNGMTKASVMGKTLQTVLSDSELDGIYFDGFGEWVMPNENYRRDHWRVADFPLTFSWRTKRPTQLAAFGVYEYLAYAAEQLHAAGKLVMANGFGYGFPFHAHWVDVGGNEIRWTRQREDFAFFDYRRMLAYRKPFLSLNNEFFDREFTAEVAEDYFRWALFYGFLPSLFAPGAGSFGNYWNTPEFHNRDRHLFRRYIPLIVRLCEAGWEPITYAWSDNERVLVERFGRWSEGDLHFTVYNTTDTLQNVTIAIDAASLGLRSVRDLTVWVLTDLKPFPFAVGKTKLSRLTILLNGTLAPHETAVLWLTPSQRVAPSMALLAQMHLRRAASKSQRRLRAPEMLRDATRQIAEVQPQAPSEWVQWLVRLQELASAWRQQHDGDNIAADFDEAQRIIGAIVREMLALQTDAVLPEKLAAGDTLRLPVDVRNAGKETVKESKLVVALSTTSSQIAEMSLGDLTPQALRRALLVLKVPEEWEGQKATLRLALEGTVGGARISLPIDEVSLLILPPLEVSAVPFGGEPSILVRLSNNTGESRKVTIHVESPLEFAVREREVVLKARATTEVKLVAVKPPLEVQMGSAKVVVRWDGRRVERWVSLIALPVSNNLLRNGSFEDGDKLPLPNWSFYGVGYRLSEDATDGKRSIFCESDNTQTLCGAMQAVALEQLKPVPVILHGFSKSEGVFPSSLGGDYSLYLDARYADGTPLWGEIVPFGGVGDGQWEWGWRLIVPEKPLREAVVHALFRYRRGQAWFDKVGLTELRLPPNLAKVESGAPETHLLTDSDLRTAWHGEGENAIPFTVALPETVQQVAIWWQRPELKGDFVRVEVKKNGKWELVSERPTDTDTWLTVLDFTAVRTTHLRIVLKGTKYAVREIEVR